MVEKHSCNSDPGESEVVVIGPFWIYELVETMPYYSFVTPVLVLFCHVSNAVPSDAVLNKKPIWL